MNRPLPAPVKPASTEDPPSNLWLALLQTPRPTKTVPFPRKAPGSEEQIGLVTMWPLTQTEQMDSNAEADRWTKKLMGEPQRQGEVNLGYHHTYANEVAVQVLWRACRNPDDVTKAAFPAPALMRAKFTTDELGVLFEKYISVQYELGPIQAYLTREQAESLILRITRDGSHDPFDSLSSEERRTLVVSMASQLVSCWMAMCSAGLQPDVSTAVLPEVLRLHELRTAEDAAKTDQADDSDSDPAVNP